MAVVIGAGSAYNNLGSYGSGYASYSGIGDYSKGYGAASPPIYGLYPSYLYESRLMAHPQLVTSSTTTAIGLDTVVLGLSNSSSKGSSHTATINMGY